MTKIKKIASIEKLPEDVLDALQERYPEGWEGEMRKITKPNNDYFYAIELDYEDVSYMVKVPFDIDSSDYWEQEDDLTDVESSVDKKSIEKELEEETENDDDDDEYDKRKDDEDNDEGDDDEDE